MGEGAPLWVRGVIGVVKGFVYGYEVLTWIVWKLTVNPRKRRAISNRTKAVAVNEEPNAPWRDFDYPKLTTSLYPECKTLDDLFLRAVSLYGDKPSLGTRELFSEEDEVQPNGKVFKKWLLGEYKWESYNDVHGRVVNFGSGLQALGLKATERIVLFAETKAEWMISAQACFMYNFPVVTLYATLGSEAVEYGINQSEVTHVITSHELLPLFKKILPKTPSVKHIIFVEGQLGRPDLSGFKEEVQIHAMRAVEKLGAEPENMSVKPVKPTREDLAVIMYTSGSTGYPKGVMISHGNLMSGMSGQCTRIPNLGADDIYIGYLPLAHVLELTAELSCFAHGTQIGYSSPNTLSDRSTKIKRGSVGDATMLKPTLMAAVPVILDRMYKIVQEKVASGGHLAKALFDFSYEYKRRRLERGYDTPVFNKTIFKAVKNILGGRIRMMLVGGAPLAPETQRFMNICFCCPVGQGYGLTETCGAGTICEVTDLSTGRVGHPLPCNYVKVVDWPEGGYFHSDKPNPRGEILLGGGNVTMGYFKNEKKTKEDYIVDNDGFRWFCTGDVGEICPDGSVTIIDRKKDLVKLQAGEYISLGKVESILKLCPLVENICVYGDSLKYYTICLIVPEKNQLQKLATSLGRIEDDVANLYQDKELEKEVLKVLQQSGKKAGLQGFEIPQRVKLVKDTWTPESGLVTDAFKLKRRNIYDYYQSDLTRMYA